MNDRIDPAGGGVGRAALEAVIARTPFARLLGARLDEYGEGRCELSIALTDQLTMHHGFAHGAVIGFLADSACAWAGASVVGDVVTVEYKLNLIAPAVGEQLVGEGWVLRNAGRIVVCRADVSALSQGRKTLVAVAQATLSKFR